VNPNDLKLRNGMRCIDVNDVEKSVNVIVPEGWQVTVMTTDSGQKLNITPKATKYRSYPSFCVLKPERVESAPEIVNETCECGHTRSLHEPWTTQPVAPFEDHTTCNGPCADGKRCMCTMFVERR
jgi:hypothetical protein